MHGERLGSTRYATMMTGAGFTVEIGFDRLRIWLADQRRIKKVKTSDLESVSIQPNGHTKLALRLQKDFVIPTSHKEAVQLVNALDSVIAERRAVDLRRRLAGVRARREKSKGEGIG